MKNDSGTALTERSVLQRIGFAARFLLVVVGGIPVLAIVATLWLWSVLAERWSKLGMRRIGRTLETAIVHLKRPGSLGRVSLVGTIHVGEPRYFRDLRRRIDELEAEGAAVLSEGILGLTRFKRNNGGDDGADAFIGAFADMTASDGIRSVLDRRTFIGQDEGFGDTSCWTITDMSATMLHRSLCDHGVQQSFILKAKSERASYASSVRMEFSVMTAPYANRIAAIVDRMLFLPTGSPEDLVLVGERDDIAADAILSRVNEGNVVSVWGAGHLPGICKRLERNGFVETSREWVTYRERPSYGYGDVARIAWAYVMRLVGD